MLSSVHPRGPRVHSPRGTHPEDTQSHPETGGMHHLRRFQECLGGCPRHWVPYATYSSDSGKAISDAALRIQTCPNYELIKAIRQPKDRQESLKKVRKLQSPLELIEKPLKKLVNSEWRSESPFCVPRGGSPPRLPFAPNDEQAMDNHERVLRNRTSLRIYTDGSGINHRVGASAYAPQLGAKFKKYLGSMDNVTVYSGELEGIDLACQLALDVETPDLDIFVDKQASIQATANPKGHSGQYILRRICTKVTKLSEWELKSHYIGSGLTKESQAMKSQTG